MTIQNPSPNPIDPASVSGLYLRLNASDPSSLNVSDGGNVSTWKDISGQGNDFTVTTAAGTVKYHANTINGKGAVQFVNGRMSKTNFFASPVNNQYTFYTVWRINADGSSPLWSGNATMWFFGGTANPQGYSFSGNRAYSANVNTRPDGWHCMSWSADGNNAAYPIFNGASPVGLAKACFDFEDYTAYNGSIASPSTTDLLEMPRSGSNISLAEILVYDHTVTWTEHFRISEYISSTYGTYNPLTSSDCAVICLGNSTTQVGYPYELSRRLADLGCMVLNLGISSGNTGTMANEGPMIMEIINFLRNRGKKVVLALHHGHNNGFAIDVYNQIQSSLFQDMRATGAHLLVYTSTPWNSNSGYETNRIIYNNTLRSPDALNYIDSLYDLGSTPEFGIYNVSNVNYPQYWKDVVHPSDAGNVKIAELVDPSVRLSIQAAPGLFTSGNVSLTSSTYNEIVVAISEPTNGLAPYTYQWYRDGSIISGATENSYTDQNVTSNATYSYTCVQTDASSFSITSDAFSAQTLVDGLTPPDIYSRETYGYFTRSKSRRRMPPTEAQWESNN